MTRFLKVYLGVSVILFGSFCLGFGAAAQNNFKLGVVDTQRVFENFTKAQEANEVLKRAQDKLTGELQGLQQEIDTMVDRLEKQRLFLEAPETQRLEADIRLKGQALQQRLEEGQEQILAKREELLAPLTQEIESLLQQVGESEGYSLILEKRLVTLYVDPKYDLTERVLKLLNDAYKQEQPQDAQPSATPPETETGKEGEKNN